MKTTLKGLLAVAKTIFSSSCTRFSVVLLSCLLWTSVGWGQSTANYAFTTNTTGSLALDVNGNAIDMTTGTTQLVAAASDQGVSAITNIGFNFYFYGSLFTQFSVSANGILQLGGTAVSSTTYVSSGGTTSLPIFGALTADAITASSTDGGGVFSKVVGTGSNRCLVLQWVVYSYYANTSSPATFQIRLYETTGVVEYVYGSMPVGATAYSSNYTTGFSVGSTSNTFASITTSSNTVSYSAFSTNAYTAGTNITNLHSTSNGSRRVYTFTPPTPSAGPTNLSFTSVTNTGMTLNWIAASPTTGIVKYAIFNSTNGGSSYNYVNTVALGTNTYAATGLTPGISYTWKVVAISEGVESSSSATGSQSTTAAATYYYVGAATGSDFSTAASWNTNANGTGVNRTTAATTDILIIDGIGTTNTAGSITIAMAAAQSLGSLQITNNTTVTIQSSATTQRILTLTGSVGDELSIGAGSSILLTNITNSISIVFATGIGMTGTIAGTLTVAGASATSTSATANSFLTTGGTGTIVTVTSSGIINNIATTNITTNGNVTGTTTSLVFVNGSQYNVSGATTGAPWVPLATWGATSTINITGITTSTSGPANSAQSFGNFIYNCSGASATFSCFTTASVTIQGNLTITSTGTGKFRALTSGTLTVNGNVNINGGSIQPMSGAGTLIVLGNTIVASGASLDLSAAAAAGSYSQRGSLFTNNGTIIGGNLTTAGSLNFYSPTNTAMTLDGSGTISTALTAIGVQTTGGLTISHLNQIATLRVNLFYGTIINSSKITIGSGAALACIVQTGYAGNTLTSGSFDQSPTLNLGTGTYSLIYSQESANRTTGFEIPSTRVLSNITLSNSNGITINGGALSSAALTFSAGCGNITTSSSNVLTITGTATTSITRTSTTAFVNGPLELTLPASLVSGSTYLLPVGKTALYPYELVNPTTNAGGTVIVRTEVFDGNCGGTAGNVMATISSSRYWAASISSGTANLTNTNIRLTETSTTGFDAIANSATQTGAYDIVGGTISTVTATTILTTTPLTSISGFYVMGSKAAATLATPSVTPSGNQCTNVSRAISVVVTPSVGAVTSVALNYSINGTAQTAIAMTNTTNTGGADTWTGTIPTVSPTNASITWSITATDANALTRTVTGTGYQDDPNFGATATATATPSTICNGSNTSLSLSVSKSGVFTIGTGTSTTALTVQPTAFCNRWSSYRMQLIYTASELLSQGLSAGSISSMAFNIISAGSATTNANFNVLIKNTTISAFASTSWESNIGATNVFPAATYTHTASGWQTINFSTPFVWDGTSNILIDISMDGANSTNNSETYYSTTATNQIIHSNSSGKTASTGTQANTRLNIQFGGFNLSPTAYSWSDGSSTIGTSNPQTATVTSPTMYTCTATVNACSMTASVSTWVNPLPTAPTATNSSQCGAGVPTASVNDNNSYTTPTFKWYSAAIGGSLLQSSTSSTYSTSISTSTTFYVAVVNASTGCESARTAVTVSVTQPDAISATTSAASICLGQSVTLTAANTASTPTQNYSYSWLCATAGSGATLANTSNPASISPSAAGSYTFTVTGTDGACNVTNTVAITVNALPNITSATASPSTVCSGSSVTLSAASIPSSSGFAFSGTGSSSSTTYHNPFYGLYSNIHTQHVVLASELTINGMVAGNITSLALTFTTANSAALLDLSIKIGNTSSSTASSFISSAMSVVYSSSSYQSTVGVNTFLFSSPFYWDGTSNIVLDFCYGNASTTVTNTSTVSLDATSYVSSNYYRSTTAINGATACASTTLTGSYSARPQFKFNGQIGSNLTSNFNWSWNSTPALSTASGTTTEINTGSSATIKTYTVTATNVTTGCSSTATTSAVTINPATVAPTATNSAQCGSQTPTCSVTGTGTSGNTFAWYTVSTGGTAISGQTASTLSSYPVATTTTLYVSENNGTCQSARTPVVITVATPPTVTAAASLSTVCSGSPTVLTASSANSGYTYSWDNSLGAGVSVTANPATNTTYTVTATDNSGGANNGCATTATVAVTTNPLPSALSLTPSTTQNICAGNIQSIVASGGSIGGSFSMGPVSPTAQGGSISATAFAIGTYYQIFDVLQATTLVSIDVYPTAAVGSTGSISIANNTGTILTTVSYTVTNSSGTTPQTVVLNYPLSIGTGYRIGQGGTAINLNRNTSNQTYPITNSYVSITGNNFTSGPTYWYYIYNWQLSNSTQQQITWSPTTELYTDAAATTAYTGNPTTVYSKPTANRTYTATATTSNGCTASASVTLNTSAPLATAPTSGAFVFGATTNTNYNTAANWYTYSSANGYAIASTVPTSSDVIVIPATSTCIKALPSLSATSSITDVEIQSGAILSLNGNALSIAGALTGAGTIKGSATSSLSFTGSSNNSLAMDQTTPGATNVLKNLTLSGSGTTTLGNALNITAGANSGSVTAGSNTTLITAVFLTLKSDASGTARIAQSAGTVSGNVTQERFVPGKAIRKWSFLASPVTQNLSNAWQQQIHITGPGTGGTMCTNYTTTGAMTQHSNGFDVTQLQNPSFYTYDAATDKFVANTTGTSAYALTPGVGYMVLVRGDRNDATNGGCVLLSANNQAAFTSIPVTLAATGAVGQGTITKVLPAGYSFIGNPYPCELDFSSFNTTNASVISGGYWTYYPTNATYTFSTFNNGTSTNGATQVIANGQSFLVNSGSGGSITFNEAHKSTTANNGNFRLTKTWDELIRVALLQNQTNRLDEVIVRFGNDAAITKSINEFDAASVNGGDHWIKTLKDATELAIQTRPNTYQNDTVALAIHAKNAGVYQLGFSEYQGLGNTEVYLVDQQENLIQNVKALPSYEFSVAANTTTANRFQLIFEAKTSGVGSVVANAQLQVYPNPTKDKVTITCNSLEYGAYQIKVRTITGAEVLQAKGFYKNGDLITLSLNDLAPGLYLLELSQENGIHATQKVTKY